MSILQLYLLTRLFELKDTLVPIIVIMSIASVIVFLASLIADTTEVRTKSRKYFRIFVSILTVAVLTNIAVPSQRDAYVILGGYYATNNEEIKKLPENIVAASNAFLKEYVAKASEELDKETKQK